MRSVATPEPASAARTEVERRRILLVESNPAAQSILRGELEAEGYEVKVLDDPEKAAAAAVEGRPDLILLDPADAGFDLVRRIRGPQDTMETSVVLLSTRTEVADKIAAFDAGADDYLTKPYFSKELLARVRTRLRVRDSLEASRRLSNQYVEMLFGIGSAITSVFKLDDEVEILLRQALLGAGAHCGSVWLLDKGGRNLQVRAVQGYRDGGPGVGDNLPLGAKIPALEGAAEDTPVEIRLYENREAGTVFVPMVARERLVGGIEIQPRESARRFSPMQQKMLFGLASQAAIFIENTRLEREVRSMFLNIIVSLAGAVDAKDAYTHGHSLRVARTALIVGREIGLPRERLEPLLMSAILHDVGKIAIPDEILQKPSRLTDEEFEVMKGHAKAGAKMLAHIPALGEVIPGIRNHHEDWDGGGYPDGLAGRDIPEFGRIILIGDAFDAMTTDRVYRSGRPVSAAMEEIRQGRGRQFDPDLADAVWSAYEQGKIHESMPQHTPGIYELIEQIQ